MSYVIYKICCDEFPAYVYVGSTTNFRVRKSHHKHNCNNENDKSHHLKIYKFIRENGGWDAWRIIVIEELGEVTKTKAHIKEEEYRVKLNGNLNTFRAYRSEEEKKEYCKERTKEYNKNNKELVKEYYQNNKEKIKERTKENYQNNKELVKERSKEYYQNNKELYGQIICECGAKTSKHNLKSHYKTKKHIKFIT